MVLDWLPLEVLNLCVWPAQLCVSISQEKRKQAHPAMRGETWVWRSNWCPQETHESFSVIVLGFRQALHWHAGKHFKVWLRATELQAASLSMRAPYAPASPASTDLKHCLLALTHMNVGSYQPRSVYLFPILSPSSTSLLKFLGKSKITQHSWESHGFPEAPTSLGLWVQTHSTLCHLSLSEKRVFPIMGWCYRILKSSPPKTLLHQVYSRSWILWGTMSSDLFLSPSLPSVLLINSLFSSHEYPSR